MATLEEEDHTAVNESDKLPTHEDAVGEQPDETPDRRHVDALLDISEENFLKELEPYEYHCCSGWEEAVSKWISFCKPFLLPALYDLVSDTFSICTIADSECPLSVTGLSQWQNDPIYIFKRAEQMY